MAIFNDSYESEKIAEQDKMKINLLADEEKFVVPQFAIGEVQDKIVFKEDGHFEVMPNVFVDAKAGDEYELPIGYNTVVNNASVLIASLIKRHTGYAGALFWEVGSGLGTWSDTAPPNPAKTDSALTTPLFRKAIQLADMSFIDGSNNVQANPTNRVQIVVTFLSNEANGYLREFGIFGGGSDCVVGTLGSGLMVNRKTHGVIYKTTAMELQRTLRFTF